MKIDQIPFETHLSTLIEHRNPEMSWSIRRQRKWPHAQTGDRVGDHFKSDNDEDKLTYHAVVQAYKFVILVTILVLGDDGGGLAERKTNRVWRKLKIKWVLDRDKIWPIFLNLEQFHGICLSDQRRIVIILVLH